MIQTTLTDSEIHALTSGVQSENGMGRHYDDPEHPVVMEAVKLALSDGSVHDALEFGSGRGQVARALAQSGIHVVATDINPIGLAALADFAQKSDLNIETRELDVRETIPTDLKGKFDLVIAKDVFPFIEPDALDHFFANVSAALKTHGKALISAPFTESKLYQNGITFENSNGEFTKRLTPDDQQFLGTTVPSFNFVTIDYLRNVCAAHSLRLVEHAYFGREKGWMWVIVEKVDDSVE